MRLGIDFGTTRVVVAAADRGNFPIVTFDCPDGSARDWLPPLVAARNGELAYGWDAWAREGEPGWTVLRSLKRLLAAAGPHTRVPLGVRSEPLGALLAGLSRHLRRQLETASSLHPAPGEALEVILGVPASANSNQRFLTVEAFRAAGFEVLGLVNEPSAASVEYSHRQSGEPARASEVILVYDLGGGTFDASLVRRSGREH